MEALADLNLMVITSMTFGLIISKRAHGLRFQLLAKNQSLGLITHSTTMIEIMKLYYLEEALMQNADLTVFVFWIGRPNFGEKSIHLSHQFRHGKERITRANLSTLT